jgi:hypothetical protein
MVRRWDLAMVEKRWRVLAYARDLCEIRLSIWPPSWPPLLALIWGGEVSGSGLSRLQVFANPN